MTKTAYICAWSDRGVALTELLTAILIMGVGMISIAGLFPIGMLSARQAVQENRAARSLDRLARAAAAFASSQGVVPRSLKDLTTQLDGDARYADGADSGYLFSLDGDRLTAIPASPGKTGIRRFCATLTQVYDCTRLDDVRLARSIQQRVRMNLLMSAGASAVDLLQSAYLSGTVPSFRPSPSPSAAVERAFDQLDADRSGTLTMREMLEASEPDTPVGRFFDSVRVQLDLGAGDEDIDRLPGISKAAVVGQAASMWSVSMLRDLTAALISDSATAQSLDAWLKAAELSGAAGDLAGKAAALENYAGGVERAAGITVSRFPSIVLTVLARLSADWR